MVLQKLKITEFIQILCAYNDSANCTIKISYINLKYIKKNKQNKILFKKIVVVTDITKGIFIKPIDNFFYRKAIKNY